MNENKYYVALSYELIVLLWLLYREGELDLFWFLDDEFKFKFKT